MVSSIFYFHPYLGKIPILANIFQRGWNHQPVVFLKIPWPICIHLLGFHGFSQVCERFFAKRSPENWAWLRQLWAARGGFVSLLSKVFYSPCTNDIQWFAKYPGGCCSQTSETQTSITHKPATRCHIPHGIWWIWYHPHPPTSLFRRRAPWPQWWSFIAPAVFFVCRFIEHIEVRTYYMEGNSLDVDHV